MLDTGLTLGHVFLDTELLNKRPKNLVVGLNVGDLDLGLFGNEIHLSFTFLFLESERDTSDGTDLYSLHEMGGETGNFVSKSLGLNNSDIINDSLVGVEIDGKSKIKVIKRDILLTFRSIFQR